MYSLFEQFEQPCSVSLLDFINCNYGIVLVHTMVNACVCCLHMWYIDMMKDSTVKLGAEFRLKRLAVGIVGMNKRYPFTCYERKF